MITLIWAQSTNGIIGSDGIVPWKIKEEMSFFVKQTTAKHVLMGRRTWDSLRIKPLPNRNNIVLTHQLITSYPEGVLVIHSLEQIINSYTNSQDELMIIGGREVFDQTIKNADKLIVSIVNGDYQGDTYAPLINLNIWEITDTKVYSEFTVYIYQLIKREMIINN